MSLNTEQRRQQILAQIYESGRVTVKDLSPRLEVSEATVRRDLRALADGGDLELVYGGATLTRPTDYSLRSKAMRNAEAKRTIGRLAAGLVADGDQLFVDSGSTCLEMCPHLRRKRGVTVITNSARAQIELGQQPSNLNIITLGGLYRPDRMDSVGPMTMEALNQLRGYVAFIGADGVSPDFGVTASDIESAHLHRLAVRNARETILLADHSKFLAPSLYKITEFENISRVVTDEALPAPWPAFFEERGIDVIAPACEEQNAATG